MNFKYFIYAALSMVFFSCASNQKQEINYMKNIESIALENSAKNSRNTLQPGDQLIITVSAKDMDVVAPFNQNYSSNSTITQYTLPSSNNQPQAIPTSGPTYTIDSDGNISFPVLGNINTTDLNVEDLRAKLVDQLTTYIKNPTVNIKLTNFKITVLGEVNKPGTYFIPDGGNATIMTALGFAGDATIYGLKDKVIVIRNTDGKIEHQTLDLTSADFVNSPYYYIKQNDQIIVPANKTRERASRLNPNAGIYISVASVAIALITLIFRK